MSTITNTAWTSDDPSAAVRALQTVSELAKTIAGHESMEALFHELSERLHELLNFTYLSVVLHEPDTHTMRVWQIEGASMVPFDQRPKQPMNESISARVWQTQRPLVLSDTRVDTEFPKLALILDGVNVRSFLSLPLTTAQRRLGALNFGNAQPAVYDGIDFGLPLLVASHVAVAVDNALHAEAARELHANLERRNKDLLGERRRLEEIVREIPGIVWEAQRVPGAESLRLELLNDAFQRLLGYPAPATPLDVRSVLAIVHDADRPALVEHIEACLAGRPAEPVVVRVSHRDGRMLWIEVRSTTIRGDDETPAGLRGVALDVTTRVEAEAAKQRHAAALLAERLEERARIAADLHDTLLQSAVGSALRLQAFAERLPAGRHGLRGELDAVLQTLNAAIREARTAVQGLRAEASSDLETTLRLTATRLGFERAIDFSIESSGPQVLDDTGVIAGVSRIAVEALTNAFRHSQGSRVHASIECAGGTLRVTITDDGIGIDPDVATNGKRGHLGVLAMRERAALLGGSFRIARRERGTSVEIVVPTTGRPPM
jgi:PAS domain S-box-containing protein